MESLLAAYSSSSDDEEQPPRHQQRNSSSYTSQSQNLTRPTSSNLSEPPKTSSLFSSLPKPKSSSISSLPPPKNSSKIPQKPKKVVQVKLPLNPSLPLDDDSDDEEKKPKKKPQTETTSSLQSFFSSLPAPKNSLGLGSGQSLGGGSGRRSTIDTSVGQSESVSKVEKNEIRAEQNEIRGFEQNYGEVNLVNGASNLVSGDDSSSNWYQNNEGYENYQSYGNYEGNYVGNNVNSESSYGHYDEAATMAPMPMPVAPGPEIPDVFRNMGRGKRGRNEMPEIIEVKQDDLTKNRPREDQTKTTGIAFGPAYQTVSSKGKPSKLHKRKHQIGALYFDMKQNEMALSERRSKGFLTKAETQAKYGW